MTNKPLLTEEEAREMLNILLKFGWGNIPNATPDLRNSAIDRGLEILRENDFIKKSALEELMDLILEASCIESWTAFSDKDIKNGEIPIGWKAHYTTDHIRCKAKAAKKELEELKKR